MDRLLALADSVGVKHPPTADHIRNEMAAVTNGLVAPARDGGGHEAVIQHVDTVNIPSRSRTSTVPRDAEGHAEWYVAGNTGRAPTINDPRRLTGFRLIRLAMAEGKYGHDQH